MTKCLLLFALASLTISCGSATSNSSAPNRANSEVAKTNVNAANKIPYEQTENAYSLAQRDIGLRPLEDLVGKTASQMGLWQRKEIANRFKELIGQEYTTMVRSWNTETPMKKFGDILMLSGCQQDNCVNNRYVIFISLSEGLLSIVHIGKDSIREWQKRQISYQALPPPFAKELDAMKTRE